MKTIKPPNYTQIPNVILDEYMKDLSGSEMFVIFAVARQTFGWHKKRAKMSISFLMNATGLSNSAVISACKSLMDKGILKRRTSGQSYEYYIVIGETKTYEKSSQPEKEPVKKSHRLNVKTYEKSSQVSDGAYEKSSHKERNFSKEIKTTKKQNHHNNHSEEAIPAPVFDKEVADVFKFYESNIGMITGYDSELIKDSVDEFGSDIVIEAIKEAVKSNIRKWRYIDGILKNWRANGMKHKKKQSELKQTKIPDFSKIDWLEVTAT